jgi:hypothetical protein
MYANATQVSTTISAEQFIWPSHTLSECVFQVPRPTSTRSQPGSRTLDYVKYESPFTAKPTQRRAMNNV